MNSGPTSGVLYLSRTAHEAALSRFSEEELNQLDAEQRRLFPPPNRKATLWRYLETYKFEDLLESETLFICQVAKLAKDEANEGRMNQLQEQALLKYLSNDQTQLENFRAFHEHVRQCSWVTCFSLGDFDEAHMWKTFCKQPPNEGVAIRTNYDRLIYACIAILGQAGAPLIGVWIFCLILSFLYPQKKRQKAFYVSVFTLLALAIMMSLFRFL